MDPYLLLALAEGCTPGLVAPLLDPHAEPGDLLGRPPPLPPAVAARLRDPRLPARAAAAAARAERLGLRLLTPACPDYPARLRDAPLRPLVLFARGACGALGARTAAIVGTRTPTPYGVAATHDFTAALCRAGFTVISGLARGLDGIAHRTCLELRAPTVAVLAGGHDRVYPPEHDALAQRIVSGGGLLLSEAPPGLRATRGHFPRRNRIVAGLADAVLVVEAGRASGALHTARFAAEHGVPVFAVPGPYTSPRSVGCHDLIADGACVARDPEDLLRRLGVEAELRGGTAATFAGTADEAALLRVLRAGPRPADLVRREARLEVGAFLKALYALQERGAVTALPGDLLALRT
jgi:DNA processing protein